MNPLNKLPAPPQGQTGVTLQSLQHLPPPPQGQQGLTLDQIKSNKSDQITSENSSLQKQSNYLNSPLGVATETARGTAKGLLGGAVTFVNSAVNAPIDIVRGLMGKAPLQNKTGLPTIQSQAVQKTADVYDQKKSPIRATAELTGQTVAGAVDVLGAEGLTKGGLKLGETGFNKVKQGYDAFKEARGVTLAEKELQDTTNLVRPKLTPTMEAEAKAAGRGKTSGILKSTEITPSTREVQMGQFAHEAGVSKGNLFDKNIQLAKDAQKTSANELRSGLQTAKGSWSRNDVVSSLNNIKTPITIKSDPTLTRLANNFKKAIVNIASNSDKKPVGLLDLRQGVDDLIEKEFPSNIYSKDTPVGQYIREIRTALNDMAESKLPEGKLPNGSTFKTEMKRQHLLYDVIDNLAEKAPKQGESARPIIQKAKGLLKKHPYISTAVLGGTAGGIVKGL